MPGLFSTAWSERCCLRNLLKKISACPRKLLSRRIRCLRGTPHPLPDLLQDASGYYLVQNRLHFFATGYQGQCIGGAGEALTLTTHYVQETKTLAPSLFFPVQTAKQCECFPRAGRFLFFDSPHEARPLFVWSWCFRTSIAGAGRGMSMSLSFKFFQCCLSVTGPVVPAACDKAFFSELVFGSKPTYA